MNITSKENLINSRRIAQDFKKQHCTLLWHIDKLKAAYGDVRLFQEDYRMDERHRYQRMYWLSKEAVLLLIGGFTGKKNVAMKKIYIKSLAGIGNI